MNIETWTLFFITSFVASIVPGPSVLLGLNHGFIHGKKKSIFTALGVTTAASIMGFVSLLGLGAVIITSGIIFQLIKYIGAGYLIYIGIKAWKTPVSEDFNENNVQTRSKASFYKLYSQALLVGLSNPKAIIFFTALFPQFINPNLAQLNQYIILISTLGFVVFFCMMIYIIGGHSLSPILKQIKIRKLLNRITGSTFIGFGAGIALTE